jgi:hypothetical protein
VPAGEYTAQASARFDGTGSGGQTPITCVLSSPQDSAPAHSFTAGATLPAGISEASATAATVLDLPTGGTVSYGCVFVVGGGTASANSIEVTAVRVGTLHE